MKDINKQELSKNSVLRSPLLAREFAHKSSFLSKKRDFNETFQQSRFTPQHASFAQNFDDSSTVRPNENTIVRNPTLLPGFVQDKTALNRSHHVQPMNLSLLQFEKQADTTSHHQTPQGYQRQRQENALKISDFTQKEIAEYCQRVSLLIQEMMCLQADPALSDISINHSQGRNYEVAPNLFAVVNQTKLPLAIKREIESLSVQKDSFIDYGFLEEGTAYFCFGKQLYIQILSQVGGLNAQPRVDAAPFKFEFGQIVTSVFLGAPLVGMDRKVSDKVLIVATTEEIRIFYYIKSHYKVELIDSKFAASTDANVIQKITQVRKTGRVFYGGSSGHVIELKFEDTTNVFSFIQGERRKLRKNDHQSEHIIKKLLPGFLKFTDSKSIVDIKVDEARNILYSVSMSLDNDTLDETIIEVFDLGQLSNKFEKVTTIKQTQIVEMMIEFWQKDFTSRKTDIAKIVADYNIIHTEPLGVNESRNWHLLMITKNGYRVFLHFEEQELPQLNLEDIQDSGANIDNLINYKFTKRWRIEEIMNFPEFTALSDLNVLNRYQGNFSAGGVQSAAQNLQLERETLSYDSIDSLVAYVGKQGHDLRSVDDSDRITLNILKKNDTALALNKQISESGINMAYCKPIEVFSQLSIPFQRVIVRNQTPGNQFDDNYEITSEQVLSLQFHKRAISNQVQELLGLNKSYLLSKGIDASPKYLLENLSEFEKQVYMAPSSLSVITDSRVLEVQQIRPIDMLAMLLQTMTDSKALYNLVEVFEEFLDHHTFYETCSMLLQIYLEENNNYLFSKKIMDGFQDTRKVQQPQVNHLLSKSSQLFRNRRTSQILTGQASRLDQSDIIRLRRTTPEERSIALGLLTKYGDSILDFRRHPEITEDALEGSPANMQDFSIKHYSLYMYLLRLLRPIWDIKVCYRLHQDSVYKPTFGSNIVIIQNRLKELLNFIIKNEQDFFGEVYQPNQKQHEKFIRNSQLLNVVIPVFELKQSHKQKLEVMEKNSLKSLKLFISRCVQAIEILQILTYNGDEKMFAQVQRSISDKEVTAKFAESFFRDIVNSDSTADIVKILEASVQLETQDQQESQALMRQRLFQIQKTCDTFFQKSENMAIIGISLLRAARQERQLPRKEELLKQAIDQLSSQPLNIDLNTVPQLLVENGNYTALADLTLRKLRALKQLSTVERSRIMSALEYETAVEHCQSIILSLFAAIDASISKETTSVISSDYFAYFLSKLNVVTNNEIKVALRDKILMRAEQFNDEVILIAIFDLLLSKPTPQLLIDSLPSMNKQLSDKLFEKILGQEELQKVKFDNIVKVLMKRGDAEKLYKVTLKAVENGYSLTSNGQLEILSFGAKLSLIGTALAVLDTNRKSLGTEELNIMERDLRRAMQSLDKQVLVLKNIEEIQEIYRGSRGEQGQAQELENFRIRLMNELLSEDRLIKECQNLQLFESLIQLKNQGTQGFCPKMIEFYEKHGLLMSEQLFQKFKLFQKEEQKQFFMIIQSLINKRFVELGVQETEEIEQILQMTSFNNTRFILAEFIFKKLKQTYQPSDIYNLLTIQKLLMQPFNKQDYENWQNLNMKFAILKLWLQRDQESMTPEERKMFESDLRSAKSKNLIQELKEIFKQRNSIDFLQRPANEEKLQKGLIALLEGGLKELLEKHNCLFEAPGLTNQKSTYSFPSVFKSQRKDSFLGQETISPVAKQPVSEEKSQFKIDSSMELE